MRPEYDFSKGERGKYFRPDAQLRLPIYLNADVQAYLAERAAQKGMPPGEMVNTLLEQEIQMIESVSDDGICVQPARRFYGPLTMQLVPGTRKTPYDISMVAYSDLYVSFFR